MNEDDIVSRWLNAVLISDVTLAAVTPGGIFEGMAQPGTQTPYVYYSMVAANDLVVINGIRVWTNMMWDVTAVAQTADPRVLRPVSARIDVLLDRATATTAEGIVVSCVRESLVRRGPEREEDGKLYLYRTQEYRIYSQAA